MGIGMRELLVILVVCLLVFGTKKLKTIGSDLGGAVRGFKKAMEDGEKEDLTKIGNEPAAPPTQSAQSSQAPASPPPSDHKA